MSNGRQPRNIQAGDTALSAQNWRDLANLARRISNMNLSNDFEGWNSDGSGINLKIRRNRPFLPHKAKFNNSKSLIITSGSYQQGETRFELTGFNVSGTWDPNSSYLVSYKLEGTLSAPTGVNTSIEKMPVDTSDRALYHDIVKFQTGSSGGSDGVKIINTDQVWQGGHINRSASTSSSGGDGVIPDHDSPNSLIQPYRSTLEFNPQSGDHENELQLYNVYGVATDGTTSGDGRPLAFPVYQATDTDARGTLLWVSPDADKDNTRTAGPQKSIQILSTGARPVINGVSQNDEQVQIYDFDNGTLNAINTSLDSIMIRKDDGLGNAFVSYADSRQLGNAINSSDLNGGSGISSSVVPPHGQLQFQSDPQVSSANSDRSQDGRYWFATTTKNVDGGAAGGADEKSYETSGTLSITNPLQASATGGAISTSGGGFFKKGIYAKGNGSVSPITATDGTLSALLGGGTNSYAGTFNGASAVVQIGGASALEGVQVTNGNIAIVTSGDFYHLGNQGDTGDGFSGGLKTDAAAANSASIKLNWAYGV